MSAGRARFGMCPTVVGGAVVAVALLAGCTSGGSPADDSSVQAVKSAKDAAVRGGADQRQVAVFDDGKVTFAEYESAFGDFQACAAGETGGVINASLITVDGTKRFDYVVQAPDGDPEGFQTQLDECYVTSFQWVDMYWQGDNPDAIAFRERRGAALRPALVRCLDAAGVAVAADAIYDELVGEVGQLMVTGAKGADCLDEIGHNSWDG